MGLLILLFGFANIIGIKLGWYNTEELMEWIQNTLLPQMNPFPQPQSVVVLDSVSMHCNPRIKEVIEAAGCVVEYLPPYSPDYSPIELTFSGLKAWLRRHLAVLRPIFQGDFGGLLRHAIERSRCDQYAVEHFKYTAGGYMFEGDYEAIRKELDLWSRNDRND